MMPKRKEELVQCMYVVVCSIRILNIFVEFTDFDEFRIDVCGIKESTGNCKLPVMK